MFEVKYSIKRAVNGTEMIFDLTRDEIREAYYQYNNMLRDEDKYEWKAMIEGNPKLIDYIRKEYADYDEDAFVDAIVEEIDNSVNDEGCDIEWCLSPYDGFREMCSYATERMD